MMLADAYAIAGAIYVRDKDKTLAEQGADLYEVVDGLGYTDEVKADLYARLEENLAATTPFYLAVIVVNEALKKALHG